MESFHLKMKSIIWLALLVVLLLMKSSCLVCQLATTSTSLSNITDHSALLAFKSAINYDPNNVLASNWNETTTSFCNWVGVQCSQRRQRVTSLRLGNMALGGTISPHIGNLSFLVTLYLHNNSFRGFLPPEISQLRRLKELRLHRNQLEGKIPISLQHCQNLQRLSLAFNRFTGGFPVELTNLASLILLLLGNNHLTGTLPPSLGNLSNIQWFGVESNDISGSIPNGVVNFQSLKGVNLIGNHFTGPIPPGIFNISSLEEIYFFRNSLSGSLPSIVGLWLPNLERLAVSENELTGSIPLGLGNCSRLNLLDLPNNKLTGPIPTNLGQLQLLVRFSVAGNLLTRDPGSLELGFLAAMTNCSSLQVLLLHSNPLGGTLPNSIGNLSRSVKWFDASRCEITGQIPKGIGSLHVNNLALIDNNLNGTIPSTIGSIQELQRLYLNGNNFEGSIPDEMCHLSNLGEINLERNRLLGHVPSCVGNLSRLQQMVAGSNSLTSIPPSLWTLDSLLKLNLSSNSLVGSIEMDMRALKNLEILDLGSNKFLGNIPSSIGAFQSLSSLNLSGNSFSGPIPESFGDLITLDFLDLSHNNLSGAIPKSLQALSHLRYLNLSYNKLSGEIPIGGPFTNFTAQSFMNNEALCGNQSLLVPTCTSQGPQKSWTQKFLKFIIPTLVVIFVSLFFVLRKYRGNLMQSTSTQVGLLIPIENKLISYRELSVATNNFCEANLLGVGSFGSVYKGVLSDGTIVAAKILNLQVEGAFKSFDAECKVLRSVRHRNMVKVISTCSNPELRALILQYMPNGSLEKWLYSQNYCLNLFQRLSIMHDVAVALEYLHHGQAEPVVHCDLKPSNFLLDENMVAHVGDFGIAKILVENQTTTQTKTLGTLGYIAPEYGSEGRVSTKGDIYSFGIMLLETFTRKKPTDEMFAEELSLRRWIINSSFPKMVMEVVDCGLLSNKDGEDVITAENHLLAIIEVGLECSKELPEERMDIKDVVVKLNKIKSQLLRNQNA